MTYYSEIHITASKGTDSSLTAGYYTQINALTQSINCLTVYFLYILHVFLLTAAKAVHFVLIPDWADKHCNNLELIYCIFKGF